MSVACWENTSLEYWRSCCSSCHYCGVRKIGLFGREGGEEGAGKGVTVPCSKSPTTSPLGSNTGSWVMLQIRISCLLGLRIAVGVWQLSATCPWRIGVNAQIGLVGVWMGTHFSCLAKIACFFTRVARNISGPAELFSRYSFRMEVNWALVAEA